MPAIWAHGCRHTHSFRPVTVCVLGPSGCPTQTGSRPVGPPHLTSQCALLCLPRQDGVGTGDLGDLGWRHLCKAGVITPSEPVS